MKEYFSSGKLLQTYRSIEDLTQAELARRLDIHVQYLSNSERGMCLLPPEALAELSKISGWGNKMMKAIVIDNARNVRNKYSKILGVE